ncbi:beta-lactamase-like protein [Striga asiatica]|uniref:Beta-lactamase-like protein n=1 Tax=Striga asiatica TaxID=4170 RepID=A0A5A7QVI4_STRAF|nr:beta-lactamase-like protein [Striga asiatica]
MYNLYRISSSISVNLPVPSSTDWTSALEVRGEAPDELLVIPPWTTGALYLVTIDPETDGLVLESPFRLTDLAPCSLETNGSISSPSGSWDTDLTGKIAKQNPYESSTNRKLLKDTYKRRQHMCSLANETETSKNSNLHYIPPY